MTVVALFHLIDIYSLPDYLRALQNVGWGMGKMDPSLVTDLSCIKIWINKLRNNANEKLKLLFGFSFSYKTLTTSPHICWLSIWFSLYNFWRHEMGCPYSTCKMQRLLLSLYNQCEDIVQRCARQSTL